MSYLILSNRPWHKDIAAKLAKLSGEKFHLISSPDDLTPEKLAKLTPKRIFAMHWSHKIPPEIFESYEIIIFHMTDLPFGRGGSPLQNLISQGIYETKISAIRCVEGLDEGPVYLKRPLSLATGSAAEIYENATSIIEDMILEIIRQNPAPRAQEGVPTLFRRRSPKQSEISGELNAKQLYDHIRMLDAPGYPPAFLQHGGLNFEFTSAKITGDEVVAVVKIRKKQ